jgi:hypothetical protein
VVGLKTICGVSYLHRLFVLAKAVTAVCLTKLDADFRYLTRVKHVSR